MENAVESGETETNGETDGQQMAGQRALCHNMSCI